MKVKILLKGDAKDVLALIQKLKLKAPIEVYAYIDKGTLTDAVIEAVKHRVTVTAVTVIPSEDSGGTPMHREVGETSPRTEHPGGAEQQPEAESWQKAVKVLSERREEKNASNTPVAAAGEAEEEEGGVAESISKSPKETVASVPAETSVAAPPDDWEADLPEEDEFREFLRIKEKAFRRKLVK